MEPIKLGTKKTVIEVEYYDLELAIQEYLGNKQYDFVAVELSSNDVCHSFDVSTKKELDKWHSASLEVWRNGGYKEYGTHYILQAMVNDDIIEPAEYIVSVSW